MIWVAFTGGIVIGAFFGVFLVALLAICKRADHPEGYKAPVKENKDEGNRHDRK